MKCKGLNRQCVKESGHKGKCVRLTGAINVEVVAINEEMGDVERVNELISARTANRRKRSDYNAYMKKKMAEYRKRKKSGFIGIAYG